MTKNKIILAKSESQTKSKQERKKRRLRKHVNKKGIK